MLAFQVLVPVIVKVLVALLTDTLPAPNIRTTSLAPVLLNCIPESVLSDPVAFKVCSLFWVLDQGT